AVYFLRPDKLPSLDPDQLIVNQLPGDKQFRFILRSVHPDKDPDPMSLEITKCLTTSYNDHWAPIVKDCKMKNVMLWSDDSKAEFHARGEKFELIVEMYNAYLEAYEEAAPYQDKEKNLSVRDV